MAVVFCLPHAGVVRQSCDIMTAVVWVWFGDNHSNTVLTGSSPSADQTYIDQSQGCIHPLTGSTINQNILTGGGSQGGTHMCVHPACHKR